MTQYIQEKVIHMERPITAWFLVGIALTLIFSYAYFVNASIMNIVQAKANQSQISTLVSSVGSLESTYLAGKSALTIESARAMGFVESKTDTTYIAKSSATALTFNR